jgi:outer membrane protein OmpA-like peptidoglycan-associated protein
MIHFLSEAAMKGLVLMGGLLFLIVSSGSAAAMDCRLGEKYYFQAKSAADPVRSIEWLQQSIEVCPNFNSWYILGLLYKNQGKINEAIDAFVQAGENAGPSKAKVRALARRGELLAQTGQIFQALRAFKLAKRFHPEPAPDWLEASLKNTRIQSYHAIIPAADIAYIFQTGTQTSMDGRFAVRPAVNLPVHFDFDQAKLTPAGSRQVLELGRALERIQKNQWSFLLVGHTDKRGSRTYNQTLSEKRADTVKMELERKFPSLTGRLKTRGQGESQLLYNGDTEIDHQLNRRVKVMIEE